MKLPSLILLPGWGMEPSVWSLLHEELAARYQLYSVHWRDIRAISGFKERVIQLIEEHELESFSLLGWSLGSLVALDIAHSYPTQVTGLIIIGGTSRFTVDQSGQYGDGWSPRILERMKRQLEKDMKNTLSSFYVSMFSPMEVEHGELDHFHQLIRKTFRGDEVESLLIGLDYLLHMDLRDKLEQIRAPLLLLHGEADDLCPVTASHYIFQRMKERAVLKTLPRTGHLPFRTQSQACLRWIVEFMGGLEHDK